MVGGKRCFTDIWETSLYSLNQCKILLPATGLSAGFFLSILGDGSIRTVNVCVGTFCDHKHD